MRQRTFRPLSFPVESLKVGDSNPIADAKSYHLGWVLHNRNDEKSKEILAHIKSAMSRSVVKQRDTTTPQILLITAEVRFRQERGLD